MRSPFTRLQERLQFLMNKTKGDYAVRQSHTSTSRTTTHPCMAAWLHPCRTSLTCTHPQGALALLHEQAAAHGCISSRQPRALQSEQAPWHLWPAVPGHGGEAEAEGEGRRSRRCRRRRRRRLSHSSSSEDRPQAQGQGVMQPMEAHLRSAPPQQRRAAALGRPGGATPGVCGSRSQHLVRRRVLDASSPLRKSAFLGSRVEPGEHIV